jgi:hypothetical protein
MARLLPCSLNNTSTHFDTSNNQLDYGANAHALLLTWQAAAQPAASLLLCRNQLHFIFTGTSKAGNHGANALLLTWLAAG